MTRLKAFNVILKRAKEWAPEPDVDFDEGQEQITERDLAVAIIEDYVRQGFGVKPKENPHG